MIVRRVRLRRDAVQSLRSVDRGPGGATFALPNVMEIIWMLIIGLIVGALAKLVMPGKDPGGIIITMLLGVAGSLLAGLIGRGLGYYYADEPAGFIASVLGAMLLLLIYRVVVGRRGRLRRRGPGI